VLPFPSEVDLGSVFRDAIRAITRTDAPPPIEAGFYPYAGLSSTIRLRKGRVYARVSDLLREAPPEVLFALASILVGKLYRKRVSSEQERLYRQFTTQPRMVDASDDARRERGYKVTSSPRGKAYDLEEIFGQLNGAYFGGKLEPPVLSWSKQKAKRVLGHHDHIHSTIVISRALDSTKVPRFVVEYVLYHEMLHVKHPPKTLRGRTVYHGERFRKDERRFPRYRQAVRWLEDNISSSRNVNTHRSQPADSMCS
jgi:predicted metal-dependent hydrolase